MSQVFEVDPARPDSAGPALEAAASALAEGLLVVLPTETVYGLASRPNDRSATSRLFSAKRRPLGLNLPVLAASAQGAWELGIPDRRATRLAAAFWPGAVTMVLPRSDRSRAWDLGDHPDSIALRVPDHLLCLTLLGRSGPLAVTSANISGRPPLSERDQLIGAFGESVSVYLVLGPEAPPPKGVPSTVVELTDQSLRILRQGPIASDRIETAAAGP